MRFPGFNKLYAMLCYAMLCYAMLCYAMLCYAMLCYDMIWYSMLSKILTGFHRMTATLLFSSGLWKTDDVMTPSATWNIMQSRKYRTLLHCTVLHCTVLYLAVMYCTVLYCTVQ